MRTVGNILWLVFAGFWLFLAYLLAGILACIFIITIPFGVQAFKLAGFVIWPFGRTIVGNPGSSPGLSGCGNVLWFILGGWWLALTHFITGVLLCIPIVTIPFAIQDFKLAGLAIAPFGREIVSTAEALRRRQLTYGGPWASGPPPPQGATISPDGRYWWSGTRWEPLPSAPGAPPPTGADVIEFRPLGS